MGEAEIALYVREELCVDVVADPAVGSSAPVRIDDDVVERNVMRLIVEDPLLCPLFIIGKIARIPVSERGEPHQLAPPRQRHIQPAKQTGIFFAQQKIDIFSPFIDPISARLAVAGGIPSLRQENARHIRDGKHLRRIPRKRKLAGVCKALVPPYDPTRALKPDPGERFPLRGNDKRERPEHNASDALVLFERRPVPALKCRAVGHKKCVAVAEFPLPHALKAHDVPRQEHDPDLVKNKLVHASPPHRAATAPCRSENELSVLDAQFRRKTDIFGRRADADRIHAVRHRPGIPRRIPVRKCAEIQSHAHFYAFSGLDQIFGEALELLLRAIDERDVFPDIDL